MKSWKLDNKGNKRENKSSKSGNLFLAIFFIVGSAVLYFYFFNQF